MTVALRARVAAPVLFAAAVAWGGSAAPVGAQDEQPRSQSHPTFEDRRSKEALARERRRAEKQAARRNSAEQRNRRRTSARAYAGLDRADALALAKRKFAQGVMAPPWNPLRLAKGQEVRRYRGDFGALVRVRKGKKLFAESMLPLRATVAEGRKRPVDLRLEQIGGRYRPKNPLVRVEIAPDAEEGVVFPALGYRVRLESAGDVEGGGEPSVLVKNKVFDPAAAGLRDTDALITPAPTGAEFLFQLRSAESPEQLALRFDLPGGLRLRMARDGSGAAEIVTADVPGGLLPELLADETADLRNERALVRISPPQVVDADGLAVPASYDVEGARLLLSIPHRGADVLYPLLVDPIIDNYQLDGAGNRTLQNDTFADWVYHSNAPGKFVNSKYGASGWGLYVAADPGTYSNGQYGEWLWYAPRRSYIERADFGYVDHTPVNSCVIEGIWGVNAGPWWDLGSWRHDPADNGATGSSPWYTDQRATSGGYANTNACGTLSKNYKAHCVGTHSPPTLASCVPGSPAGDPTGSPGNAAVYGMIMTGSVPTGYRARTFMYGATMWLYDRDVPKIATPTHTGLTAGWTRSAQISTSLSATEPDPGLGVKAFNLYLPQGTQTAWHSCTGDRFSRCPITWAPPAFTYHTDSMPEGITTVGAVAYDVLNKSGSSSGVDWDVKVDRTKPTLKLSGPLYNLRDDWLYDASADLRIETTDGATTSKATRRSGVEKIDVFVKRLGETYVLKKTFAQACTHPDSCPLDRTYTLLADDYADGGHLVKVVATDYAGNSQEAEFQVNIDRKGDIYHARHYLLEGTDRVLLDEEWGRLATFIGRREEDGLLATRDDVPCEAAPGDRCAEYRVRMVDADTADASYASHRGIYPTDPDVPHAATILIPPPNDQEPDSHGPIQDALVSWQRPPPAHGGEYELYSSEEPVEAADDNDDTEAPSDSPLVLTARLWVERKTKMPLQLRETLSDGTELARTYWSYSPNRLELHEVPDGFFAAERPDAPSYEEHVVSHGNGAVGEQTDRQTGHPFAPYYLGPSPVLPNGSAFCLQSSDGVEMDYATATAEPYSPNWLEPDPEDPEGPDEIDADEILTPGENEPDPSGPETFVAANYYRLALGETCSVQSAEAAEELPLSVVSMARASSQAASFRRAYQEDGIATQADLTGGDFFRAGVQPVTIHGEPVTAYVVATGDSEVSAFLDYRDTALIVTGPFDKTQLEQVLQALEVR